MSIKQGMRVFLFFILCVGLYGFYVRASDASENKTIVAAGSGVNLGITRILAEAFHSKHPDMRINIPESIGSKGAIQAVADNGIAIGLLSRPLKDSEKKDDLLIIPYARTSIVVGVNPTVDENGITSEELVQIYDGKKNRWEDGHEIIVYTREPMDSGIGVLKKKIPGFEKVYEDSFKTERWFVFYTDQDANKGLSSTPYAIGFTDLGMIQTENLNIKPLNLDGVEPSPETLENGSYPLVRPLYLLVKTDNQPEEAKAFIDFIRSPEGADILRRYGYSPGA